MNRNLMKKSTYEDKFERKFWVHNKAKTHWIRWTKRVNNKSFRRQGKEEVRDEITKEETV